VGTIKRRGGWRWIVLGIMAMASTGAILSSCSKKAKQEAILALDAARLSLADVKGGKTNKTVASIIKEAESTLKKAEESFEKKEYAKAKDQAESAAKSAKLALEKSKEKHTQKALSAKKSKKS
jgi:Na+/phosphate symporter